MLRELLLDKSTMTEYMLPVVFFLAASWTALTMRISSSSLMLSEAFLLLLAAGTCSIAAFNGFSSLETFWLATRARVVDLGRGGLEELEFAISRPVGSDIGLGRDSLSSNDAIATMQCGGFAFHGLGDCD